MHGTVQIIAWAYFAVVTVEGNAVVIVRPRRNTAHGLCARCDHVIEDMEAANCPKFGNSVE